MTAPTVHQLSGAIEASVFACGELTFIGTATVLVRYGGFTFLTDPNFLHQGQHAHLGWGLRSERLTDPASLDFVALSHHHGDHFDDSAAEGLPEAVPIVTEPHAADKLREQGATPPLRRCGDRWRARNRGRVPRPRTHVPSRRQRAELT